MLESPEATARELPACTSHMQDTLTCIEHSVCTPCDPVGRSISHRQPLKHALCAQKQDDKGTAYEEHAYNTQRCERVVRHKAPIPEYPPVTTHTWFQ